MANNYTAYEAAKIIKDGLSPETASQVQDVRHRYPLFTDLVEKLNDDGMTLLMLLGNKVTARLINTRYRQHLNLDEYITGKPKSYYKEKK